MLTVLLILAIALGEAIPWWIPAITGALTLLLHGLIILSIYWSHPTSQKRRSSHD